MPSSIPVRAIDRLCKAANLEPTKKVVQLSDGSEFEMWVTPLTAAERERAEAESKSTEISKYAVSLLISKANDENGNRLFAAGEIDILKKQVRDSDLQSLMVAVIADEQEPIDPKS